MAEESVPLGGKVVTKPFLVLAALALVGGILIILGAAATPSLRGRDDE